MVGQPAGGAEGSPERQEALTPDDVRLLLSDAGRSAVALAQTLDLTNPARVSTAQALRDAVGPLAPLALDQALLKARARAKHPRGDELWWTGDALEQATSHAVAVHRARRFARPVLDVCCSVGGDLLALPEGSVGIDLDEARLLLAAENARVLRRDVSLVRADALVLRPRGEVFADPARRAGGRRVFDARAYSPPLAAILAWDVDALGVKVAPGIDDDAIPPDMEVEVVSLNGDVKEAVLWGGTARRGSARSATLLPSGAHVTDRPVPTPSVRPPGPFLLEPDGAVIRAHLVAQVVEDVQGWLLDATIAYVSAQTLIPTPFGSWFEVLDVLPFGLKRLREVLRAHDAGQVVVKKRGTAVEPDVLRKQLKLSGRREVTVVLTRSAGAQIAMVVRRLSVAG